MKNEIKIYQSVSAVALATALLLLVPLVAMQFTNEVVWSVGDFIVAGALLFSVGLSYVVITRFASNIVYRVAIGFALGIMLFMAWANLAVGLIGAGPNAGNLMYLGVVAVGIIGTILSRFKPAGMERVLYALACAVILVAVIALMTNMDEYPGSSVSEIIGVNGFFAVLFAASGLLFRYIALKQLLGKSED